MSRLFLASLLWLAIGAALGLAVRVWWERKTAKERRRIPKKWPLMPRVVANTEERYLWRWLSGAFFDHYIMLKLPVTRFILPRTQGQSMHWYQMLSAVYCTFTIVDAEGNVIGCVDVVTPNGPSRHNQQLKKSLLQHCRVEYLAVEPTRLPRLADIRATFLGDLEPESRQRDAEVIHVARENLKASLQRRREARTSGPTPLGNADGTALGVDDFSDSMPSQFASQWVDNSFLTPLDSRKGQLR